MWDNEVPFPRSDKDSKSFEKSDMTIEERKMIEKPFTALGSTNLPPRLYQAPDASETPTRSEDISTLQNPNFPIQVR